MALSEDINTDAALTVYEDFSNTKYGAALSVRARYDRFRPKDYPVKYWERLLGHDVNNLHHMRQTIALARWFLRHEETIRPGYFSKRQALTLTVTAALHDQAEAIIGDIPHGRKSPDERKQEAEVLRSHEAVFAPRVKGPLLTIYRYGRDRIAFDETQKKLPSAFRTIELMGFMKNAFAALKRLDQLKKKPLSRKHAAYLGIDTSEEQERIALQLERLIADVFSSGAVGLLIDLGLRFPSAHVFLSSNAKEIDTAFCSINSNIFAWYGTREDPGAASDEMNQRTASLIRERAIWEDWRRVRTL